MCLPDGVTARPKACDPWLKKLVDTGLWAADEILFIRGQDLFPADLSPRIFSFDVMRVIAHEGIL